MRDASNTVVVSESRQYDAFNRLACVARPSTSSCATAAGRQTFTYDDEGHMISTSDGQGDEVFYGSVGDLAKYDRFGRLSRVRQETCDHDATGINGTCTSPSLVDIDYSYDAALQVSTVSIDPSGLDITTQYVTDDFGNVVSIASPDAGTSYFLYDAGGRLTDSLDANGSALEYRYDRIGRLTSRASATDEIVYCYDGENTSCSIIDVAGEEGNRSVVLDRSGSTVFEHDAVGRLLGEYITLDGASFDTQRTYDENGNVISFTAPNGLQIERTFNLADRETTVMWRADSTTTGTVASNITWHPFGGLASWDSGGWRFEIAQDSAGRITASRVKDGTLAVIDEISYGYADDGNVSKIPATVATPNVLHDSMSRLRQDREPGHFEYRYDATGNLLEGPNGEVAYTAGTDRWTKAGATTFTFDDAGNVIERGDIAIHYNPDHSVSDIESVEFGQTIHVRDYRNLLVSKYGAAGSDIYFYAPSGELLQWNGPADEGGCNPWGFRIPHQNFVMVGGRRIAAIESRLDNANCVGTADTFTVLDTWSYFADKMDLARGIYSHASGAKVWAADFDAFGAPVSVDNDPDGDSHAFKNFGPWFLLPGQFALHKVEGGPSIGEKPGLYENWHRLYDSAVGRYIQPDPMWHDLANYRYAADSPLRYIDPRGQDVIVSFPHGTSDVEVTIDERDQCCKVTGSTTYRFGPGQTVPGPASGIIGPFTNPTADLAPPPSTQGKLRFCTDCDGDKAALKRLSELSQSTLVYDPQGVLGYSETSFANEIVRSSHGTQCLFPTVTDGVCVSCR